MKHAFAVLASFLCAAGVASAQPSLPPTFKIVASTDKDKGVIVFRETTLRLVPEQREVVEIVNGMQVTKVVTSLVPVFEERMVEVSAAKSRVITPDGKQLPIEDVWKRLKAQSVVVVSSDGKTPAPEYLSALNAQTLVVILPQPPAIVTPVPIVPPPVKKKEN